MKRFLLIGVSTGIVLLGFRGEANTGLVNGSFESWRLRGWTVEIPHGTSANEPFDRTAGSIQMISSWGESFGFTSPLLPQADSRFAELHTRANANFTGNGTYDLYLSQNVQLQLGELLSGWSFFYDGDLEPQDSAWVRIFDQAGNQIATPWLEGFGSPSQTSTDQLTEADWSRWEWEAPIAGVFTVRLGMSTSGNNNGASFGFFDGLTVQIANPVPEPGFLAFTATGAMLLVRLRRKSR